MEYREFFGYNIFENGSVYNQYGRKLKPTKKKDGRGYRYEIRLHTDKGRQSFILSRLLYYVFNPDFNIEDKNLCVVYKDRELTRENKLHIDNLEVKHRKDLIQGDSHHSVNVITSEVAEKIRSEYKGKAGKNQRDKKSPSYSDLAKKYNTSRENIIKIVKRESRNKEKYKLK